MLLQRTRFLRNLAFVAVMLGITVMIAGCGQCGPEKYDLSGSVTYQGKPVPVGQIFFQPDKSQDNSGPSCVVGIKDGRYDTSVNGNGHVGGPHVLVISGGADQSNLPPEERGGGMMFHEVPVKLDLPKNDSVQDIEVPTH